jgi:DNA-binding beta-propeller fold protein YncE
MSKPHALLRIGLTYNKTLGMRRLTNTPSDLTIGEDDKLYVLCRGGQGVTFIRTLTTNDDDLLAFNLVGKGGGGDGGDFSVEGQYIWPAAVAYHTDGTLFLSDEGTNLISHITTEGKLLEQWGESGTELGQLNRPSGIEFDSSGNLLIVNAMNNRIDRFTTSGKFLDSFGADGKEDGQLNMPWGISVSDDDNIYVTDWRNHRVQIFNDNGKFLSNFGNEGSEDGEFKQPTGIAVDKNGDVFVADKELSRVQLFNSEGNFVQKITGDATLSRQGLDFLYSNPVALRIREMTPLEPQKSLRNPTSVKVDSNGAVYITDYASHRIQVYKNEVLPLTAEQIAEPLRSPTLFTQF